MEYLRAPSVPLLLAPPQQQQKKGAAAVPAAAIIWLSSSWGSQSRSNGRNSPPSRRRRVEQYEIKWMWQWEMVWQWAETDRPAGSFTDQKGSCDCCCRWPWRRISKSPPLGTRRGLRRGLSLRRGAFWSTGSQRLPSWTSLRWKWRTRNPSASMPLGGAWIPVNQPPMGTDLRAQQNPIHPLLPVHNMQWEFLKSFEVEDMEFYLSLCPYFSISLE